MSRRNPKGREINGIVLLDKDTGLSSNAALQEVKRLFFAKKAGHTGALDPLASGILPICLGQATKVAGFLLADDKRYFVRGQLGQITDTADAEGEVIKIQPFEHLTDEEIRIAVNHFVGDIEQVPPMYSALKKDGQPLYKLARQGIEIDRPARPVTIHNIDYLGYESGILSLEVSCSKGTYIR
ncbi:MAG: tRNA pseudouridine(55) synthase TruB, partial [Candidatus Thioglobus sp.]